MIVHAKGAKHVSSSEPLHALVGRVGYRARRWLEQLRRRLTPSHEELQKIETESSLLVWLAAKYDGADYDAFRKETARLIADLQALGVH